MEKSIKRVEKLVHATNSALAQMKFSLMFDDLGGDEKGKHRSAKYPDPLLAESFLDGDDLKQCQEEFKAEASQMLAKVESMAASNELARKNSKAVDRIKEINRKMNTLRLEHSKHEETEQSRQKLLNLINEEKFSPGMSSNWDSARTTREKKTPEKPPKRTESVLAVGGSKDELKSKILETQEIVDRGFQTARQLAQKVETMSKGDRREKTPSTEKTASEINLRSLEGKTRSESNESVHSVRCRRKRREKRDAVETNARVIEVRSTELQRSRRPNLQMQRLPSVNIRGGLQLQKIHSLEIPAGGDGSRPKSNTAVSFLTHDQLGKEKMEETIEKVRKENCRCSGNKPEGSYVECFNCGKLIRIRETGVDPRKVDEILQQCNFDVFDPRIDEFVEKCATVNASRTQPPAVSSPPVVSDPTVVGSPPVASDAPDEAPRTRPEREVVRKKKEPRRAAKTRCSTLQGLSDQVFGKFKRETETLESNHLKLDSILQNLFRQVDESREVFQKCHLLENRREEDSGPKLTATKPVLVSLTGTPLRDGKRSRKLELSDAKKKTGARRVEEGEPREAPPSATTTEVAKARRRTSLIYVHPEANVESERKEGVTLPSSGHAVSAKEEGSSSAKSSSTGRSWSSKRSRDGSGKEDVEEGLLPPARAAKPSDRLFGKEKAQRKYLGTKEKKEEKANEKTPSETLSSSSSKSRRSEGIEKPKPTERSIWEALLRKDETERKMLGKSEGNAASESSSEKSENNYESDFESVTNEPNENVDECEEEDAEGHAGVNKLSTISEVDSELEKRLSEEAKTGRSSRNTEDESEANAKNSKNHLEDGKEGNENKEKGGISAEASIKSTPTELVTSLKDILTALQDQFVRTESLAEKLTENIRSEEAGKPDPRMPSLGDMVWTSWKKPTGAELVENLRSARKDSASGSKTPRRSAGSTKAAEEAFSVDSLSEEGGSSLGEIIVSDRRRKTPEKSPSSTISECSFLKLDSGRKSARVASDRREANPTFKLEAFDEEIMYSEGEIPTDELLPSERFRTTSVGEVISGRNSTASSVE